MSDATSLDRYVERFKNLETEKQNLSDLHKDLRQEAKSQGYDARAIMKVVKRIMADEKRRAAEKEKDSIARVYAESIGQGDLF